MIVWFSSTQHVRKRKRYEENNYEKHVHTIILTTRSQYLSECIVSVY